MLLKSERDRAGAEGLISIQALELRKIKTGLPEIDEGVSMSSMEE